MVKAEEGAEGCHCDNFSLISMLVSLFCYLFLGVCLVVVVVGGGGGYFSFLSSPPPLFFFFFSI